MNFRKRNVLMVISIVLFSMVLIQSQTSARWWVDTSQAHYTERVCVDGMVVGFGDFRKTEKRSSWAVWAGPKRGEGKIILDVSDKVFIGAGKPDPTDNYKNIALLKGFEIVRWAEEPLIDSNGEIIDETVYFGYTINGAYWRGGPISDCRIDDFVQNSGSLAHVAPAPTLYRLSSRHPDHNFLAFDNSFEGKLVCNATSASFENGIPDTWEVIDNTGGDGIKWVTTSDPECGIENRTNGSGNAACANRDIAGPDAPPYDTELISNPFTLADTPTASLDFTAYYQDFSGNIDYFTVDIWDGTEWQNLLFWNEDHQAENLSIDLGNYLGMTDLQIRFRYQGDGWNWFAQVDDVQLNCSAKNTLDFPADLNVLDLDVSLVVNYEGTVSASLASPHGTLVQLFDSLDGGFENPDPLLESSSCEFWFANAVSWPNQGFDDEEPDAIEDDIDNGFHYFFPVGNLSDFDHESALGEWELILTDKAGDSLPKEALKCWSLDLLGYRTARFNKPSYSVSENAGSINFDVELSEPSNQKTAIQYVVTPNPGSNQVTQTGIITFEPWETIESFAIKIQDDDVPGNTEQMTISLTTPVEGIDDSIPGIQLGPGTPSEVTLTIVNDDKYQIMLPTILK